MTIARHLTLLSFLCTMTRAADSQQPRPTSLAHRSTVYAPHAMIATSQPLATAAGLAVLERGGNAVDAAVTAAAVLNVVEPQMTGIGGDLFAIVWSAKDHRLYGLNASGRSGSLMTSAALLAKGHTTMPQESVEDVTVPGALSGWDALLRRFGSITLAQALRPAIGYAEGGFPVTPIIAAEWATQAAKLRKDEGARTTYLLDDGRAPQAGEWFRNRDLARSLRLIAEQGIGALYGGELGSRIAERVRALGGYLTVDDLRNHRPEWVEPIAATFKGYRVWELPPNGQGVAALEMLKILEPYDLKALGHNSAPYLHLLIEAKKLAFADIARYVGEPTAMTLPAANLLTDAYAASRRALLDPSREADLPNTVAPGKRPFHTIIPAFVTRPDGRGGDAPWLSFGVMGGSMQPQGHVQLLLNLIVFGMDLQDAIDAARFRHLEGRRIALEAPIADAVRRALATLGHELTPEADVAFGGAQAIMRLPRGYAGGSDPRKDGMAAG